VIETFVKRGASIGSNATFCVGDHRREFAGRAVRSDTRCGPQHGSGWLAGEGDQDAVTLSSLMSMQKIPCLDLKGQHQQIRDEVLAAMLGL